MTENAEPGATTLIGHVALRDFCTDVLRKAGVPVEEAEITADSMVVADLRGVDTHGVTRLSAYVAKIESGVIRPRADIVRVRETSATALLDGQNGLGQVIAKRAMEIAIQKAKDAGVAYVVVRNSNHMGTCAYYSMMALPHDMIGLVATNASARLAPTGGVDRLFGNNPWSIAVPAGDRLPVVLDMANSVVAAGKVRTYEKEGKRLPEGWALNQYGEPTTDPSEALKGIFLAIGGYKGYGITLVMDLLTGVLANSAYGPRVKNIDVLTDITRTGHAFAAIDLKAFDDVSDFKARMDSYIDEIKGSRKARGVDTIYLPGELEFIKQRTRIVEGIPLPTKVEEELRAIGAEFGVPLGI